MKKICFLVTTPFAANSFLIEHLKALSQKYEVTLCLNQDLYPISPIFDKNGIRIINIPIKRKLSLFSDLKILKKLFIVFNYEKFDSVHTLTPKAGLLGMLAAYLASVPLRLHTFTGQIWVNENGIKRHFYKAIDRIIVYFSTQVFCDSQSQKIFLVNQGIVKEKLISVIGQGSISGVDIEKFIPQSKGNEEDFIFLFVGRLTKDKGIFDLIKAFQGVYKENSCVQLWIVGPDEDGLMNQIKHSFPLLEGVSWIGPRANPEKFMAKADILILPSYREGFGTVIIEAAACKTATIAYRIYGVIDAIEDGKSGILVDKGDSEALECAMKMLVFNPHLAVQLGEVAYQRAINLFSSKKITNDWLELYKSVILVSKK